MERADGGNARRRKALSYTWAALVVGWSLVRAIVVWATLTDYGVNPWVFLAIDLLAAAIDGYTTPRAVLAVVDRDYGAARYWFSISAVAFVAPDVYLVAGGEPLPPLALAVIGAVVVCMATASVLGLRRRIRAERRARDGDPVAVS